MFCCVGDNNDKITTTKIEREIERTKNKEINGRGEKNYHLELHADICDQTNYNFHCDEEKLKWGNKKIKERNKVREGKREQKRSNLSHAGYYGQFNRIFFSLLNFFFMKNKTF